MLKRLNIVKKVDTNNYVICKNINLIKDNGKIYLYKEHPYQKDIKFFYNITDDAYFFTILGYKVSFSDFNEINIILDTITREEVINVDLTVQFKNDAICFTFSNGKILLLEKNELSLQELNDELFNFMCDSMKIAQLFTTEEIFSC